MDNYENFKAQGMTDDEATYAVARDAVWQIHPDYSEYQVDTLLGKFSRH